MDSLEGFLEEISSLLKNSCPEISLKKSLSRQLIGLIYLTLKEREVFWLKLEKVKPSSEKEFEIAVKRQAFTKPKRSKVQKIETTKLDISNKKKFTSLS